MDRLARSVVHAASIIEDARAQRWPLVVLDIDLDLSTAAGRMMDRTVVNFAEYERELISEGTKAGPATGRQETVRRANRAPTAGGAEHRAANHVGPQQRSGLRGHRPRTRRREHFQSGRPAKLASVDCTSHLPERHGRNRTGGRLMAYIRLVNVVSAGKVPAVDHLDVSPAAQVHSRALISR